MAAEAVVIFLLERLATLALNKVGEEFNLVTGVETEVKSLTRNLKAIQAVLEDAEQRQVTEATVRRWLAELSEVSNDMENVLDEWSYELLKLQMEKVEKQGESALAAATNKKKVCLPFLSSCFCFKQVINHLMLRRDIAVRMKELSETIDLIAKDRQSFSFQNITRVPTDLPQRQNTTSLPNAKTFGRDHENDLILSKLLSEGSEGNEVPLIIPIIGMGGMGKTCLAQLVYNDEKVRGHFERRIWVCVSEPFEEIKICKAVIEGLDKDNTSKNSNVLQTLTQCIFELIEGKKFLLVLDDVWSLNSRQWEELIKPLQRGATGSRVLVTTRKEEVVTLMKAAAHMIPLQKLSEAFCLALLCYNAGMNEGNMSKEFQNIALEIVKKCDGLPLAAKTLGSLMFTKREKQQWQDVLTSKTWELKEVQQDVFRPLLLSYHDLAPTTKRCLLYCALFPKDYVFDKTSLIELWMSQDYLHGDGNKRKRKIGQDHFDDLVIRSFFQDVFLDKNGDVCCKIHDIVHDFLQYLTQNECMTLEASKVNEVSTDKIYHLGLVYESQRGSDDSSGTCLSNGKRLRTLILSTSTFLDSSFDELIVELKYLRTLKYLPIENERQNSLVKIPESLGGLIHLRYLDLSHNKKLEELPADAMGRLYNLQTLRLVKCLSLTKIDVGRLINLRHLYVNDCEKLKLIKGIGKCKHLQRLDEFRVGAGGDEENKLEDLKELNQLQGLLHIDIAGNPEEKRIMVSKVHLSHLRLFGNMDNLEPHPKLESLFISYHVSAFPRWLSSLHGLREITLRRCHGCEVLPPLGKLGSLESLTIVRISRVEKVGIEFLGIEPSGSNFISFPKLQKLEFVTMRSWEEWEGVENNITIMPCLSELTVWRCEKLKALPDFLWKTPLQKLEIVQAAILANLYREETGEDWAKISHIPTIQITS